MSDKPKSIFGVVFLTIFLDMVGFSVIFPLFPSMLDHYLAKEGEMGTGILSGLVSMVEGMGYTGFIQNPAFRLETVIFGGLLGSLYAILQFFFAPIWGGLSDRLGRRRVLAYTLGGTALGYLLWIFADAFWILLLSRALGGIASGNLSVATAAIADVTSRENRSKGMAFVGIAFGLGFVLGPALGGIASHWDWSGVEVLGLKMTPFSAAAAVSLLLALINWLWLFLRFQETLPEAKRKDRSRVTPAILGMGKVGNQAVRRTCLTYLFYMISFSGMEFTLTFLAVERFSYHAWDLAKMFLLIGGTLILVQGVIVRRFVGVVGERNLAHLGILVGLGAFLAIAAADTAAVFYPGLFLMSTGVALISPTLTALTSLSSGESEQGFNLGVFRSCGSIARAVGPMAAGLIYFSLGSSVAYIIGAVWLLVPALILTGVKQPQVDAKADTC